MIDPAQALLSTPPEPAGQAERPPAAEPGSDVRLAPASSLLPAPFAVTSSSSEGRYIILGELGSGGMGTVYRAQDKASGRVVALKQLASSALGKRRRKLEALFEREYHTLARLRHPRIIEVYDYGLNETGPFYTMELLDGQDLQQLAPLDLQQACLRLRDIASSLALLHAQGLVHRDVSPRNVRATRDGRTKLIDFGALTSFGTASEVVGTPPCMAPEVLRRMPLDQRTDLYALGAVAYWTLTGRHARPARGVDELSKLWTRQPMSPSVIAPGIPPELDALVLSLLSVDPLARPQSAAAVIERLTAIGGLEPEEHEHSADSYLRSGRMVGREGERQWVRERLERARRGHGVEIVIEGPAGIGRTRLLRELSLEAQLGGFLVLGVEAQATPAPFGAAAALASSLLRACPELASSEAAKHAQVLAPLSAELTAQLAPDAAPELAADPREQRASAHAALHDLFLSAARRQPLLLAVDDLQAADEGSASLLAALSREGRGAALVVMATLRTGDAVAAPAQVSALRKQANRVPLAGLDAAACEELVRALFGDVANCGRVALLLYNNSGGNPQQLMDLAQLLVSRRIAKYASGTWVLPLEVAEGELPSRMEEIALARLAPLSALTRDLVEALSIYAKPVALEHALLLAAHANGQAQDALDELIVAGILSMEGGALRFRQETLREAVLGQMDAARRSARRKAAAEALLAQSDDDLDARMEAGFLLLHAGQEGRGADLLASTARRLLKAHGAARDVRGIVRALRDAVDVYERQGRPSHELATLLFPLMPFAYYSSEWRLIAHHAEKTVRVGLEVTGLGLAFRLRHLLGRKLALRVGAFVARARFSALRKRGFDYSFEEAIASFSGALPAVIGVLSTMLDAARLERLRSLLQPLSLFAQGQFPAFVFAHAIAATKIARGLNYEAGEAYGQLIAWMQEPRMQGALPPARWKTLYGGMLYSQAILLCYASDPRALELAREMEQLGVRAWETVANQLRMMYHAYLGEADERRRYHERVELSASRGGTTWQVEMFLPVALLNADVLSADTVAARRSWEQLSRLAKGVPTLEVYRDAAHAAYLMLRGDLTGAIEAYERLLPELGAGRRSYWLPTRAYFATALNAAGQHQRAKQVASEALSHVSANDKTVVVMSLEVERQLALAEAGLGRTGAAVAMLDTLLGEHRDLENPLLLGLLHEARADVALKVGDAAGFEAHFVEAGRLFRGTRNPALVARVERLAARAVQAGVHEAGSEQAAAEPRNAAEHSLCCALSELSQAVDPCDFALQLIMREAHAKAGYLYLFTREGVRLMAASSPQEPPRGLETQLHEQVEAARSQLSEDDCDCTRVVDPPAAANALASAAARGLAARAEPPRWSAAPAPKLAVDSLAPPLADGKAYRLLVLRAGATCSYCAVGGLILEVAPNAGLRPLPASLLEGVATALQERGVTVSTQMGAR